MGRNCGELEQPVKIDADFCVLGPVRRGHGVAAPGTGSGPGLGGDLVTLAPSGI